MEEGRGACAAEELGGLMVIHGSGRLQERQFECGER